MKGVSFTAFGYRTDGIFLIKFPDNGTEEVKTSLARLAPALFPARFVQAFQFHAGRQF